MKISFETKDSSEYSWATNPELEFIRNKLIEYLRKILKEKKTKDKLTYSQLVKLTGIPATAMDYLINDERSFALSMSAIIRGLIRLNQNIEIIISEKN